MNYDFIFAGAGPAGLTGAIHAARQGRRCLLIDKKTSLGLHPRGETLRHRPILDEVLGQGVMDRLTIAATRDIDYFAPEPEGVAKIAVQTKTPNLTFEWHEFMEAFESQVRALDIELALGSEVTELRREGDRVTGVVFRDAGAALCPVTADVVFACDGHGSFIGNSLGVDYGTQNYPIIKSLFRNASFDSPAFKFFFLPAGCLPFAPDFPPAMAFLFPRDGANCEVGFMVEATAADLLGLPLPGEVEMLRVFDLLIKQHSVLCDMLAGASSELIETTMLPMGGPRENVIPAKGAVLLGDAAGFVETFGGSGLISSMESARFWVDAVLERQAVVTAPGDLWSGDAAEAMVGRFRESGIYRHIKSTAEYTAMAWRHLFVDLRTSQAIMDNWATVRKALDIY